MSVRPATPADAVAVAALAAEDETRLLGRPSRLSANDVAMWWSRTELRDNSWLIEEHGELVAAGWAEKWGEEIGTFVGIVAPGWKDRGIGAQLVERGEAAARRLGAVRAHAFTLAADARAAALFTLRGYREARRFYDMAIELDGPPPRPRVPEGLRLETFRPDEAHAFWQALDEAFHDHWEHHSTPFEEWWEQKQAHAGPRPHALVRRSRR